MTNTSSFPGEANQQLPSGLKTLTLLTLIGSALQILQGIWGYFGAQKNYDDLVKAQSQMQDAPEMVKKMMGPEMVEMAQKAVQYKLPIMLMAVVGGALCLYGALQMRKLKKDGYTIWLAGELLPVIGGFLLLGGSAMTGWMTTISMIFPMIFIILYTLQRKHLVN